MSKENCGETIVSLSRRDFLARAGGAVAVSVVAGSLISASVYPEEARAEELEDTGASGDVKIFDGVELSIGRVVHDPDICSGSRTCEIVCSVYNEGIASSSLSRIQWNKRVMDATITDIMMCKQCAGAECVAVCPNGALHVDETTGARVIDAELCVGCQVCLNACPVEPKRIRYNAEKNICFKCNLCGGDPQCVKFCPTGALAASWVEADTGVDEGGIFELNVTGEAKPFAHVETSTLVLNETETGLRLDGVVWTSHATQFDIILAVFDVTADFYDANGTLLATSDDSGHIEIPEMSSGEFALNWATSNKITDIGKVVLNVAGECVRNAPAEEE